jgi:hypothetical protein
VADPWTADLAALGEATRLQPRSLAATRAHVLSTPEKSKMRIIKSRPFLAALIILALAGIASGAVYVAVDRVLVSVDPDKSAPEIEKDIEKQLRAAGITGDVRVEKQDKRLEVRIESSDQQPPPDFDVRIAGAKGPAQLQRRTRFATDDSLTESQVAAVTDAGTSYAVMDALLKGLPDAELAAVYERELAARGFHDVEVTITSAEILVEVGPVEGR